MRRTQIYLEDEQAQDLQQRSALLGTTQSELIRRAVATYLERPADEAERLGAFRKALGRTAGMLPPVDDDAVPEGRRRDRTRDAELERRWRE